MTVIRIGSSKVKTGCSTCKSRHLKCDETHPICLRCIRSGFHCGYNDTATKQTPPRRFVHYIPAIQSSTAPCLTKASEELRGHEYFRLRTATSLVYPFTNDLWSRHLLLLAEYEPAIGYALAAFGLAHQHFDCGGTSLPDTALRLYNESIKLVVQRWTEQVAAEPEVAIASSLVFVCLELLRGCFRSAISIVASANRLLTEVDTGSKPWSEAKLPVDEVRHHLVRLTTQLVDVGGFVDEQEDYRQHSEAAYPIPLRFRHAGEAMGTLGYIYNHVLDVHTRIEQNGPDASLQNDWKYLVAEMQQIRGDYHRWLGTFWTFQADYAHDRWTPNASSAIAILDMLSHLVGIMVDLDLLKPEEDYDRHMPAFKAIVDRAESQLKGSGSGAPVRPLFSLTTAYVGPLYMVAARCRNSNIRHRALSLLRSCQRREGMWDSKVVAGIAEKIIALEESNRCHDRSSRREMSTDSPMALEQIHNGSSNRIKLVRVDWNEEAGGRAAFSTEYAGSACTGDRLGGLKFEELVSW